ncbi:colicin-like pore-forming protein [Pseudescherichia vulneris]|uniref:colicin-like pore-forming protein n=1 Tax=Pseudescherichia vulneris TaxID=566 RepID=UPI0028CFE23F|nr:colicin-like pore-forming protein [Pseudescherichia vulneris]
MPGFNYGGGVGDGTGWSSERGNDTNPGADNGSGNSGNHDPVLSGDNPGVISTPFGNVTVNSDAQQIMKGIVMTTNNSTLVEYNGSTYRVLNSILDHSFMKPEPRVNSGVTATTPSRIALAASALVSAQQKANNAAANITQANANINHAQVRLNNANNAIPLRQAEVNAAQSVFDAANSRALSLAAFAHADPISPQFRSWQQAGFEAQKAQNSLKGANNNLTNTLNEKAGAEKALNDAYNAVTAANAEKKAADLAVISAADMKDAITTATTFFENVSKKFGDKAAFLAQEFAADARGKTIRNATEALAMFEKHKGTALSRLSVSDKEAIANAFKSLDHADMAKQLYAYSKVFGRFNTIADLVDLYNAVYKGVTTDDWKDAINKFESLAAGKIAGELVAVAFAVAGSPLSLVGFGVVMMLTGAFFSNETVLSVINTSLGM